jgi:hypothetical protein
MKLSCPCGATIPDQGDDLSHKGHMVPDRAWFATLDALDDEVIEPLAKGRLTGDAASQQARRVLVRSSRLLWQCRACARLFVDGPDGKLRCFQPEGESHDHEVLR